MEVPVTGQSKRSDNVKVNLLPVYIYRRFYDYVRWIYLGVRVLTPVPLLPMHVNVQTRHSVPDNTEARGHGHNRKDRSLINYNAGYGLVIYGRRGNGTRV
jgi:hypothetical protein